MIIAEKPLTTSTTTDKVKLPRYGTLVRYERYSSSKLTVRVQITDRNQRKSARAMCALKR